MLHQGTHQQQVQQALNEATAVLVVKIRNVEQVKNNDYPSWEVIDEGVNCSTACRRCAGAGKTSSRASHCDDPLQRPRE